jgi:hypothetical protein
MVDRHLRAVLLAHLDRLGLNGATPASPPRLGIAGLRFSRWRHAMITVPTAMLRRNTGRPPIATLLDVRIINILRSDPK